MERGVFSMANNGVETIDYNQDKTIKEVGYVWARFNEVEVYRLLQVLPIYGVIVDIYKPVRTKGSIRGLKTTNLEYEEIPTYKDLKVIITNLEHYNQGSTLFESFEEDGFLLKTLSKEPIKIPDSSKIVVKEYRGVEGVEGEHMTFASKKGMIAQTPVNGKIAVKYELTPLYLVDSDTSLFDKAKELQEEVKEGAIIPDYVQKIAEATKEIKKEEYTDDDILVIDDEGGFYND
jgi:hypothetical protein